MLNPAWQSFLEQHGAHIQDGVTSDFGDAAAERAAARDGTILCDLGQFGLLKASGEDAQSFLQNLLSNDIKAVSPQHAQLSSLNTPKGRVLATFLVWQHGSDYFLQLHQSLAAAMQKKLSMYVLRSKVKIEDASARHVCLGLSGPRAAALLRRVFGAVPEQPLAVHAHESGSVICVAQNRFLIATTAQFAEQLWQTLSAEARPVGSPCWDWLSIRAGLPVVSAATQEEFVLQMLNLEVLGGVSFKKGCYPGQEIVARMQYLGQTKRRMYLAHVAGEPAPQAGDKIFGNEADSASGMVVNAAPAPGGGYDVLAVLMIASHDSQPQHLGTPQGPQLQFADLPYAVPDLSKA